MLGLGVLLRLLRLDDLDLEPVRLLLELDGPPLEVALEVGRHVGGSLRLVRVVEVVERLLERLVLLVAPGETRLHLGELGLELRRVHHLSPGGNRLDESGLGLGLGELSLDELACLLVLLEEDDDVGRRLPRVGNGGGLPIHLDHEELRRAHLDPVEPLEVAPGLLGDARPVHEDALAGAEVLDREARRLDDQVRVLVGDLLVPELDLGAAGADAVDAHLQIEELPLALAVQDLDPRHRRLPFVEDAAVP